MEREIKLVPGWSRPDDTHPAELLFILRYPNEGAVVAIVNTGWYPDGSQREPRFVQISIHAVLADFAPILDGEEICDHCDWLGEPCWVPRSSFYQPGWPAGLAEGGSEWAFARMEEFWQGWQRARPTAT